MTDLYCYENELIAQGYRYICGIDEAGRGPLFGPVYAGAVILSPDAAIDGIDDSKKLSAIKREKLFSLICENAIAFGIGSATEVEIDEMNILNATYLAMRRAYESMGISADYALVDGNRLPTGLNLPAKPIVKGDATSASIAAASILAKVARDRLMMKFDVKYPEYGFSQHKGYPTKMHYQKIREFGILPEHRKSFLRKFLAKDE